MSAVAEVYTKAEGYPWFRSAVEGLELGSKALADCWDASWSEFERQEAKAEPWRGWIRMLVQRAKSPNVRNAPGLLLKMLREGSETNLAKPKKASAALADWRASEWGLEKERRAKLAEDYPGEHRLSLCALMYAYRAEIDVQALVSTWERAGRPAQEALDLPGWDRCLEKASRDVAS